MIIIIMIIGGCFGAYIKYNIDKKVRKPKVLSKRKRKEFEESKKPK